MTVQNRLPPTESDIVLTVHNVRSEPSAPAPELQTGRAGDLPAAFVTVADGEQIVLTVDRESMVGTVHSNVLNWREGHRIADGELVGFSILGKKLALWVAATWELMTDQEFNFNSLTAFTERAYATEKASECEELYADELEESEQTDPANSESSDNTDPGVVLTVRNVHVPDCGPPPGVNAGSAGDSYVGFFQSSEGEQWLLTADRTTKTGVLRGGDLGWETTIRLQGNQILDDDTILSDIDMLVWLDTCWHAATGCELARFRGGPSQTFHLFN